MRGVSNVISSIFVVAVILIAAYLTITTFIERTEKLHSAAKRSLERIVYMTHIKYGRGECNTSDGMLTIPYEGEYPEYSVRVVCMDNTNPSAKNCIVPRAQDGKKVYKYVDEEIPGTLELNIALCPNSSDMLSACSSGHLICYAIGVFATQKIPIQ